jgi:hypothetical protein
VFDGEVSRAWCAFVEGLVGSQSVVGVAEQVDFDGEGVAVADVARSRCSYFSVPKNRSTTPLVCGLLTRVRT